MKRFALYIIIAVQIILLLSIVGKYQYMAATGMPITLKTSPIDPVDPFYGEYVTLHYEVNEIDRAKIKDPLTLEDQGETVYVLLERQKHPWYDAAAVYRERPAAGANQAVLRGKLQYIDQDLFHIDYGWERYYVPENTGREIEQQQNLLADLRVMKNGEAIIERIRW